MQATSDAQLLREYVVNGSEPAFTAIVTRHTNLVYSAALRQTDSLEEAAEVTQSVFVGLARGARTLSSRLTEDASLAGWLCRSARNISLNMLRDEFRQRSRERQAMEQMNPISEATLDWERLRPMLDEAMSELNEADYDALVMRFFNNQDLRTIGQALGVTDDTAQKRVSRALDKLRESLSRRGINNPAAALSIVLSANAVQAAPAGLAVSVSAAAALATPAISATALIPTPKTIAMTALHKSLIAAVVATALGTGIYEARRASTLLTRVQSLQQQQAPLAGQIEQLTRENTDATRQIAALREENERLNRNTRELLSLRNQVTGLTSILGKLTQAMPASNGPPQLSDEPLWKHHAAQLKQYFELNSQMKIPEFQFLAGNDSFYSLAVKMAGFDENHPDLKSDEEYRRAAAEYRMLAESGFAEILGRAYNKFSQTSNGRYPDSISELQPFFEKPVDDSMLQRYEIQPSSNFPDAQAKLGCDWVITQKTPIDTEFDYRILISTNGSFINWYKW